MNQSPPGFSVFLLMMFLVITTDVFASVLKPVELYEQYCMSCHADDASGEMPGVPDLIADKSWMQLPEKELLKRMIDGIQTPGSVMIMPPRGGAVNLSDQELMSIIRYMKKNFR